MTIRILLLIEYNLYHKVLKETLEKYDNICVINEICSYENAKEAIVENTCDIIITDSYMKNNMCMKMMKEIKKNNIKIMVLLSLSDNYNLKSVMTPDYNAIVSLSSYPDKLVKVINIIINNGKYIDDCFNKINDKQDNICTDENTNFLTNREREVLVYVAQGCFNKEIASKMNITERTVKNYVSNIFKKIDVCDRTQAAVYAIRNNIVNL